MLAEPVSRREPIWVPLDPPTTSRGPSGLVDEAGLVAMVTRTEQAVRAVWSTEAVPVVVAGDCPVLLGPLRAMAVVGGGGLVFVDGHEDAWAPHATQTGEASDVELGLALGRYPAPPGLAAHTPLLHREHLLMLGARDGAELDAAGQPSLLSEVVHRTGSQLAAESDFAGLSELVRATAGSAPGGWWFHVDLDVLCTADLPAVDYPQPGGLSWQQLTELSAVCLAVPGCRGLSVVIYNPDLDGGAAAATIARFVADAAAVLRVNGRTAT
jgi:arginase